MICSVSDHHNDDNVKNEGEKQSSNNKDNQKNVVVSVGIAGRQNGTTIKKMVKKLNLKQIFKFSCI